MTRLTFARLAATVLFSGLVAGSAVADHGQTPSLATLGAVAAETTVAPAIGAAQLAWDIADRFDRDDRDDRFDWDDRDDRDDRFDWDDRFDRDDREDRYDWDDRFDWDDRDDRDDRPRLRRS